ncbi:MAG: hypothetical protein AAGK78_10405, partial [Planctomycetota bacterium]
MQLNKTLLIATAGATLAAAAPALASEGGDVGVRIVNGQIDTISIEEGGTDFSGPTQRVFVADFGEFEDGDEAIFSPPPPGLSDTDSFVTNLPGFDTLPDTFTPGVNVGLDVNLDSTFFGSNVVEYDPATDTVGSTSVDVQISFGSALSRTDGSFGTDPLSLPTFSGGGGEFDSGRWHRHYVYAVYDGLDTSTGDLIPPANGVYILEAVLSTEDAGIADSDSIFLVFGVGASESDVEAAEDFLLATIPEPASLALLGVGVYYAIAHAHSVTADRELQS